MWYTSLYRAFITYAANFMIITLASCNALVIVGSPTVILPLYKMYCEQLTYLLLHIVLFYSILILANIL